MESQKSSESTSSSNGEIPERANAKTEKNSSKNYVTNVRETGNTRGKIMVAKIYPVLKMTQNFDLNEMTTDRGILPNYRDDLEHRIRDLFIWALGESAITEMTRTVRDNDPNKMDINQLHSLFRLHFLPERNKYLSRVDFFGISREKHETAEDVWTRILKVEKNCEFENVTPAELIAAKFLSVIGRSTGDYELKMKMLKSDMTIETITTLIHEHKYDRLNESNHSNDGKENKHVQERPYKRKWTDKTDQDKSKRPPENQRYKQRDNRCGQCGAPNWTGQHICPAKMAECRNCKRRGHYEKMCRSTKRVQ